MHEPSSHRFTRREQNINGRKTASVEGKRYFEQGFGQRFSTVSSCALTRCSELQQAQEEFGHSKSELRTPSSQSLVARQWTSLSEHQA
jgi:hypothetical protein